MNLKCLVITSVEIFCRSHLCNWEKYGKKSALSVFNGLNERVLVA